jgi:hypothetical protein
MAALERRGGGEDREGRARALLARALDITEELGSPGIASEVESMQNAG